MTENRYVSWTDVVARYASARTVGGSNQMDNPFIVGAEAEIDARLGGVYVTPFVNSPIPEVIRDLAIDLAYYKMSWREEGAKELKRYIDDRFKALIGGDMIIASVDLLGSGDSVAMLAVYSLDNRVGDIADSYPDPRFAGLLGDYVP